MSSLARSQCSGFLSNRNNGQGNLANNLLSLDAMREDCPDFKMSS